MLSDGTLDQWNAKPPTHDVRCDVRTTVENPKLYASNRQQSPEQREVHAKIIADMLKQGVIEPSKAPWSSNSVVVERDGKKRLVIDYRKLNEVTIRDNYPMPRIQDLTDHLMGTKWFSGFDCTQAFHQVPMADERSKDLTSFRGASGGLYRYRFMPNGFVNAKAIWSRFLDTVLEPWHVRCGRLFGFYEVRLDR